MTVKGNQAKAGGGITNRLICQWFTSDELKEAAFIPETLELVRA